MEVKDPCTERVEGTENVADALTKALGPKFQCFMNKMGLVDMKVVNLEGDSGVEDKERSLRFESGEVLILGDSRIFVSFLHYIETCISFSMQALCSYMYLELSQSPLSFLFIGIQALLQFIYPHSHAGI